MTRNVRIILLAGAAAALLLAVVLSTLKRSETARSESVTWAFIEELSRGGYGKALAFLDERILAHPNDALLYYYRARLNYEAAEGAAALRDADRAISLGYAQEVSHLLKGLVHGRLYGDWRMQADLASKALVYDPMYSDGYLARAEARYALGDYAACAQDAAAVSRLEPASAEGWEYSLLCLAGLGDQAGAEAAGLKVLALKPGSHAALWRLGRSYAARGQHKRAIKDFSAAIRLSGGRAPYYLDRAASCAAEGDFSCEAWDLAAAMDWKEISSYASYYLLLGTAMHRVGELDRGLAAADRAAALAPGAADAYALRARLRAEAGDAAGAAKDLKRLAGLAPDRAAEAAALVKKTAGSRRAK
ncbi:MAG: hypothetical protein HY952_00655 [Elusimicrobia bacterium]|nr:hypothetical protein [Elusimicrobiota bacterium]